MQLRARRRVEITVFSFHSRTCGLDLPTQRSRRPCQCASDRRRDLPYSNSNGTPRSGLQRLPWRRATERLSAGRWRSRARRPRGELLPASMSDHLRAVPEELNPSTASSRRTPGPSCPSCSRSEDGTTRSSFREPRPPAATARRPRCTPPTRAASRWRRTPRRSPSPSATSSGVPQCSSGAVEATAHRRRPRTSSPARPMWLAPPTVGRSRGRVIPGPPCIRRGRRE